MPNLKKLAAFWLTIFAVLNPISPANAQQGNSDILADLTSAASAVQTLNDTVSFSLKVVHSVKFPLTDARCYYQFFVDAQGSSPLSEVKFNIELAREGRIIGLTEASVSDLDGTRLSNRIREFAFDGPCQLDGIRITEAIGGFQPASSQFSLLVNLFERQAISIEAFEPLEIALGTDARLPGAPEIKVAPTSGLNDLERECMVRATNLRSGPGTDFNIVTILQPGVPVFIERRTGDGTWNQVRTQFGRQGWVYYTLLGSCPSE